MTVEQVIEMLKKAKPTEVVKIFDPDSQKWERVTGMTYGAADNIVQLYSDEP